VFTLDAIRHARKARARTMIELEPASELGAPEAILTTSASS
jgi:hypothetical protein